MRYMKQFFLGTLLNRFLDEPYVENSQNDFHGTWFNAFKTFWNK